MQDKTFVAEQIAEKILEVGRVGKRHNIPVVTISSLFVRKNYEKNRYTQEVNEILKTKCADEGFKYIDQGNIKRNDISSDNLHLDDSGISKLRTNLLNHLNNKERSRSNNVESDEVPTEVDESDDEGRYRRIVPGTRTYSETLRDGEKAMIFSSSITKGIDTKRFNDCYVRGTADFQRFPGNGHMMSRRHKIKVSANGGANIEDLRHHLTALLRKNPDHLILQAGTNDAVEKDSTSDEIFDGLIGLKKFAEERVPGIKVTISCPILRTDNVLAHAKLLKVKERLRREGLETLSNDNINEGHLTSAGKHPGLHLNSKGTVELAKNYISYIQNFYS